MSKNQTAYAYTVRSVDYHDNVVAECQNLFEAICVRHLYVVRYNFTVAIYDNNEYLVPQKAQLDAIEGLVQLRKP